MNTFFAQSSARPHTLLSRRFLSIAIALLACLCLAGACAPAAHAVEFGPLKTLTYDNLVSDPDYLDATASVEGELSATSVMSSASSSDPVVLAAAFISSSFEAHETESVLPNASELGIDESAVRKGFQMAVNDPRFFYVKQSIRFSFSTDGKQLALKPSYLWSTKAKIEAEKKRFYAAVADALTWVGEDMSDLEKAQALHDYLVRTCTYDKATSLGNDEWVTHTAYGALVNKSPVCQGYMAAYKLLCSQVGVPCEYVISTANAHGWNIVQIDGSWYHVDITFDDPLSAPGEDGGFDGAVEHRCFLISDSLMQSYGQHYPWTCDVKAPSNYPSYSYPTYNKAAANSWSKLVETGVKMSVSGGSVYSGSAQTPKVTLARMYADGTTAPVDAVDYSVSYTNNVNAGKGCAVVTLGRSVASKYSSNKIMTLFTIKKASLGNASATLKTTSYVYNGSAKRPGVKNVKVNGKSISSSKYSVRYSSNKKVGIASAKISFANYSGSLVKTFKIKPKKVSYNFVSAGSGRVKVTWKPSSKPGAITGYQVRYSASKKMANAKMKKASKTTRTKTVSSLSHGKCYYFQVRAYTVVKGKTVYSGWSTKRSVVVR